VDGRVSIYNPETQQLVSLNDTATAVWSLSTGEFTLDQIVSSLARTYAASGEDIRPDVIGAVALLSECGLLTSAPE